MKSQTVFQKLSALTAMGLAALVLSSGAYAQHGGGGGGHAGGFGGGHAGGYGGGYHGGGYRGGYYGGYRGGYYGGYRGGYYGGYGWRGGYWGGGCWGCWGWGLGLGLYFATLPYLYSTYYWGGVPYYYADNTYYTWDPNASQYVTVAPPAGLQAQVGAAGAGATGGAGPSTGTDLIAYPKNGQTPDQQAKDKFDCHQWAVGQSGFDPSLGTSAAPAKRNDYMRAQAACLEGRGYSVQ